MPHSTMMGGNESTLTIVGLVGAATASNHQLPLQGPGATIFGSTGAWNQQTGTLSLKVAAGQMISAGVSVVLMLPLTNPPRGQQSPRLFTYVTGICARFGNSNGSLALPARYIDVDTTTPLEELASAAGDGAPLFVRSPSFVVRKISQSVPVVGAANRITLTLGANVEMESSTVLTVRGLVPTSTASTPRTLLAGGYSHSVTGSGSYKFYGLSLSNAALMFPVGVELVFALCREGRGGVSNR